MASNDEKEQLVLNETLGQRYYSTGHMQPIGMISKLVMFCQVNI